MKLGTNDIGSVYLGTNAVQKVYLGTNEVWTSFTGLLDDYPNAAAAYSLRLLRSAYTGSAIRVRNSSNSETDIGFVNNVLDTASLLSHCGNGDGFVTKWYDQSGNGYDATQATAANQPQIVSGGSVILENGKASVYSDGVSMFLDIPSITILQPLTYFIITRMVNNVIAFQTFGNNDNYLQDTGNNYRFRHSVIWDTGVTSDNTYQLIYALANGTNSQIAVNNGTAAIGNAGTSGWNGTSKLFFRSAYQEAYTHELIYYPSDQSSNRTGISTNINNFYSIY